MSEQKNSGLYHERREFFNERAERWLDLCYLDPATGQHSLHDPQFARLFEEVKVPADGVVLDVGCGSGVVCAASVVSATSGLPSTPVASVTAIWYSTPGSAPINSTYATRPSAGSTRVTFAAGGVTSTAKSSIGALHVMRSGSL